MPYGYRRRRYGRSQNVGLARRQGGTGATYSGSQDIIRHSATVSGTLEEDEATAFPLVVYNPTKAGTPYAVDGSSAKTRLNNYCDLGSRVDYVTVNLTIKQTDTSKNNTAYVGTISTSFNEARLTEALMDDQFGNGNAAFIEADAAGEMDVHQSDLPLFLNMSNYYLKDILQHNVKRLGHPQFQLYSGRVIHANQVIPIPFKNRRQQEGSFFGMVLLNDSSPNASDIEYRLDTFFKEIPSTTVS